MSDQLKQQFMLRPLEKGDLADTAGWFRDVNDLATFDRSWRAPLSLDAAEKIWRASIEEPANTGSYWFVVENRDEKVVAMVGLDSLNLVNRDAVVALFVDHESRRNGVGIRAVALILDLAFKQFGLNRITSYYREDNRRSADLMARLGVEVEGRMRQAWYAEGRFFDMIVVGMLRDEWAKQREVLARELSDNTIVALGCHAASGWKWPPHKGTEI